MILDATCGYRDMWFAKNHEETIYMDIKREVHPDIRADFRQLPFRDEVFDLVVFDPPHASVGETGRGIFYKKYGSLRTSLVAPTLYKGSRELWRVLRSNGILIFKWNTHDRKLSRVLKFFPTKPLFGQKTAFRTAHASSTHWVTFQKLDELQRGEAQPK